jgi:predicted nucleic acid-binding protein
MPNSVYWDACLFIEVLQRDNPERFDACRDMIDKAEKKSLVIVTSSLTITEVNKFGDEKASGISREEQSKKILTFFGNAYIKVRALDRQTAELAHHLTRLHGLKNMDAIHIATALLSKGVTDFYTYDGKKGRRGGLLTHDKKIGSPPLRIKHPPKPSDGPLYDKLPDSPPPAELPAPPTEPPPAANGSTHS